MPKIEEYAQEFSRQLRYWYKGGGCNSLYDHATELIEGMEPDDNIMDYENMTLDDLRDYLLEQPYDSGCVAYWSQLIRETILETAHELEIDYTDPELRNLRQECYKAYGVLVGEQKLYPRNAGTYLVWSHKNQSWDLDQWQSGGEPYGYVITPGEVARLCFDNYPGDLIYEAKV